MAKRMIFMLVGVVAFIAIIGSVKFLQIKSAMASQGSYQPPPEAVTTAIARQEQWETTLSAIGTVAAVRGVIVSADLPGIVDQISFDSGRWVNKGDVLVRLDTKQERAQLAAAEADRDLKRQNLTRGRELRAQDIVAESTLDQVAAEFKQAEARMGEIRATIERKTIRAPFSGVLGIRQVNVGQFLEGGKAVVPLQTLQPVYVDFTVPQQEVGRLTTGSEVRVTSDAFAGIEAGKVTAVDSVVDEVTRSARVQSEFGNASSKLRPGMFVEVQLGRGGRTPVIVVPVSAISYAPFGDSVFIVEQLKGQDGKSYLGVRQQFVKLGGARGDLIAVLTGVKAGEEVVTSGAFKLRPNAAVKVNNSVQPSDKLAPKPEDS